MSRTYKDQKKNKKWDKRNNEYDAGFMKAFKRASNKKMRKTPITSPCLDVRYSEQTVAFKVLKNIEVVVTIKRPEYSYMDIENKPVGLDIWSVD
jgi:hypothetical protein